MLVKGLVLLLCLLAGFWAVTLWMAARNEARAEADFPPEGRIIQVDGHPVHLVQRGSGPDVVLVHGASGNTRDMSFALLDALVGQGFRVTAVDRPGLGYTPAILTTGDTISAQAGLLSRAVATVGVQNAIVVGQSYGGAVALAWALDHPQGVAGLVLTGAPSHPWTTPLPRFYQITTHPVFGGIARTLLAAWVSPGRIESAVEGVFAPQSAPAGYTDHFGAPLSLRRSALRANGQQRAQLLPQIIAQVPRYPGLTLPIEILHGTVDTTVGMAIHSEPLAAAVASARLTPLPGIGHMPHHVAEPEVLAAIDRAAARAGLR